MATRATTIVPPQAAAARSLVPAVSRRTVLAAAATGGAGLAAARLLGIEAYSRLERVPITGTQANVRGLDWASPLASEPARVAHLLRRTAFGATAAELEQARSDGWSRTVDRILETPAAQPPELAGADAAAQGSALQLGALQQWWLDWMQASATPFIERMTLFWHGHFTSDFQKVGLQSPFLYWQNRTWRSFALGDLRSILTQVTVDPAMLRYLDLATSTGRSPNENYSRELMELFSMGAGSFAETDVQAAAKALAGWREPRTAAMIAYARKQNPNLPATVKPDEGRIGVFEKNRAYSGPPITFLGERGTFATEDIIDRILKAPSTAPYIVRKALVHFALAQPPDALVARLADRFRATGYDVRSLMRDVFTAPEFSADAAYRSLVRSPTEFMISTAKALENPQLTKLMLAGGPAMGQILFGPPSVGGWPENESWVSSNTMLARANFVTGAVAQTKKLPDSNRGAADVLDNTLSPQTLRLFNESGGDQRRWALLLVSPEFQLK